MIDVSSANAAVASLLVQEIDQTEERYQAQLHPAGLVRHIKAIDSKTGERFSFDMDPRPEQWRWDGDVLRSSGLRDWSWQRIVLDWWITNEKTMILKARQLGVTWLAGALALWYLLYKPGATVLVYSITEDDAAAVIARIWDMYESLPAHLRKVQVIRPQRGRPYTDIVVKHPDGRISEIHGMPATKKAGQGRTAALVLLDEVSRLDYAREIWKSTIPTMADGGRIIGVSTANGVSNALTGEGNFFHHLWVNTDLYNVKSLFIGWDMHPGRDEAWYQQNALSLPAKDRSEQYPSNAAEAFILSGDPYFDPEHMSHYAQNPRRPLYRMSFESTGPRSAKRITSQIGWIRVYAEPDPEHKYGISADVSSGRGVDFSSAFVIDLQTGELAAEFHGKVDYDIYAMQLHYLGRWYGTAVIAPEVAGGYGDGIVVLLRDGKDGRPPYPKLYRHRQANRADLAEHKPFGFPTNSKTRPLILEGLQRWLRERTWDDLPSDLLMEMQTFVYASTNPSPRAMDGCNDDRVMAVAIALELFRQYGHHPDVKPRKPRKREALYPWLAA